MINNLVHSSAEMALLSIVYQETKIRNVNIARCPCNELGKHEMGGGDIKTKNNRHNVETDPTYYHI